MIKKLKTKFIVLAMTALLILLAVIVTGMNIMSYNSATEEADTVLAFLAENKGRFPDISKDIGKHPRLNVETPHESRFFTVFINADGVVSNIDLSKIAALDEKSAFEMAQNVILSEKKSGYVENYRYIVTDDPNGTRVIFLDCGRRLDAVNDFLTASITMSAVGYSIVFVIIVILSGRITKPIAEAYEKQKRFITDAGHEIKTPLTIINANVDLLEMDFEGGDESLDEIRSQTARLKKLTDELVLLSRMEEDGVSVQKLDFPVSDVVNEEAGSFRAPISQAGKALRLEIEPNLSLNGDEHSVRRLVGLLLDNALKYSPDGSTIELALSSKGKSLCLCVANETSAPIDEAQLALVFDRFYRTDSSRNSESGGHGIGLSVARAIVNAHGGKIFAEKDGKDRFVIKAVLPK